MTQAGDIVVEEVPEVGAPPAIAAIYADIRATQDLPLVNLIWRHLAIRPAALEWAWEGARPLYAEGLARRAALDFAENVALPRVAPLTVDVMAALGLARTDIDALGRMLNAYNQGNTLNLMALSALLEDSRKRDHEGHPPAANDAALTRAYIQSLSGRTDDLPPIPTLDDLPDAVRNVVREVNHYGTGDNDSPLVATLYRHIAPWPAYLATVRTQLKPLADAGDLDRATAMVRSRALDYAPPVTVASAANPGDETFARTAIATFVETAIARMVPLGFILRATLPTDV